MGGDGEKGNCLWIFEDKRRGERQRHLGRGRKQEKLK